MVPLKVAKIAAFLFYRYKFLSSISESREVRRITKTGMPKPTALIGVVRARCLGWGTASDIEKRLTACVDKSI
ncbi:hypothetical protein [Paenibacillus solani]|uniref:Uncharacterized protein n=1 Tax=Paenibacillus solani TaxID=1705565 RepID=A0A0M1P427_9BACL|nr:hypothetical protein [Paenibacillus solani]KOR89238.1 hypothetical protein AM231_08760 [Paenibacillus solani]